MCSDSDLQELQHILARTKADRPRKGRRERERERMINFIEMKIIECVCFSGQCEHFPSESF